MARSTEREAKVLASLNHPGIAGIYGPEEQDQTTALVLELVDRIAQGPIQVDEALPIARQIAKAQASKRRTAPKPSPKNGVN